MKPGTYVSAQGRTYVVGEPEQRVPRFEGDTLWCDTYPVTLDGEPAGKLFKSESYGLTTSGEPRWHASLADMRNRHLGWGEQTPYGLGFDVAAFDSIGECLAAWGRNADALLDWRAKNPRA